MFSKKGSLFFYFLINSICGLAQDGHYWTENHGTRSTLLNGVVIGSVADLGAVYYNPARLGQINNPAFLLSGKVYQLDILKIENGAGNGLDLNHKKFGGAPNMAAGSFRLRSLKNHHFAYSFLTRYNFRANYFIQNDDVGDIIQSWPGDEIYGGQFSFQKELKEDWIGLTWAHALNDTWSIGVTNFVTIRNQNEFLGTKIQAFSSLNELAILDRTRGIDFQNIGLLWKLALAFQKQKVSAGITITTPKINLTGKGSTLYQNFFTGATNGIEENLKDEYISYYQNHLKTKNRTPWAIGFGTGISFEKSKIHLSGEFYGKVKEYDIISSDPFIGQSSQKNMQIKMLDALNPVFNVGLGYEYTLNSKFSLFSSCTTDFSAVEPQINQYIVSSEIAYSSMIQANMYHVGGGFLINTSWLETTIGATYGFANQNINRPFQFPENEDDLITIQEEESKMFIGRWRFVLGFSFPFFQNNKLIEFE